MPQPLLKTGEVVLREWNRQMGLRETVIPFSTLDELFALCLSATSPELIDRVVLRGADARQHPRTVVFEFQSITVTSQDKGE